VCGTEYRKNVGVIVYVEHDLPVIGCIKDIYLINSTEVLFSVKLHHTCYEKHFRAYILERNTFGETIIKHSELFLHTPLRIRKSQVLSAVTFVFLPHALCTM